MVRGTQLLVLTVLVAAFVVTTESATLTSLNRNIETKKAQNEESETPELDTEEKIEESMKTIKERINHLSITNKENEEAFVKMQEQVAEMDKKVKDMIKRLKKVNSADYLNGGAEEIEKL